MAERKGSAKEGWYVEIPPQGSNARADAGTGAGDGAAAAENVEKAAARDEATQRRLAWAQKNQQAQAGAEKTVDDNKTEAAPGPGEPEAGQEETKAGTESESGKTKEDKKDEGKEKQEQESKEEEGFSTCVWFYYSASVAGGQRALLSYVTSSREHAAQEEA